MPCLGQCASLLCRYREILRYSCLFVWNDDTGKPWCAIDLTSSLVSPVPLLLESLSCASDWVWNYMLT